jgi:hypothetical protein
MELRANINYKHYCIIYKVSVHFQQCMHADRIASHFWNSLSADASLDIGVNVLFYMIDSPRYSEISEKSESKTPLVARRSHSLSEAGRSRVRDPMR